MSQCLDGLTSSLCFDAFFLFVFYFHVRHESIRNGEKKRRKETEKKKREQNPLRDAQHKPQNLQMRPGPVEIDDLSMMGNRMRGKVETAIDGESAVDTKNYGRRVTWVN